MSDEISLNALVGAKIKEIREIHGEVEDHLEIVLKDTHIQNKTLCLVISSPTEDGYMPRTEIKEEK
jgi:hypothetical protein